jgi:hypothetical protein
MVMFIPQTAHSSDEKESSAATIIVLITTNPLRYEIDTFMDEFLSIVGTMYICSRSTCQKNVKITVFTYYYCLKIVQNCKNYLDTLFFDRLSHLWRILAAGLRMEFGWETTCSCGFL